MKAQKFGFEQFNTANDITTTAQLRAGVLGDDEEVFWDLPPSPSLRRVSGADAFPICRELLRWPQNYPVEDRWWRCG